MRTLPVETGPVASLQTRLILPQSWLSYRLQRMVWFVDISGAGRERLTKQLDALEGNVEFLLRTRGKLYDLGDELVLNGKIQW